MSAPVFRPCSLVMVGRSNDVLFRLQIHHLPARHAGGAGRARKLQHQFGADEGIGVSRGIGENLERQRVEAVARQDRGRLVESLVDGGFAASEIVIVHRRQIVMNQRIDMDAFERERGAAGAIPIHPEQPRGGEDEQRPQALAAADRRMAHRPVEIGAGIVGDRQQLVEPPIDIGGYIGERGGERQGRGRHGERHPAANGVVAAGRPSPSSLIASIRACAASSRSAQRWRSALPRS